MEPRPIARAGPDETAEADRPMPEPAAKRYTLDTHRCADPHETLARVAPFLARMGITRIADVTGLDRIGIPTVMVTRPNSRSVAVAQGKGLSLAAARASGVMEAIETWHAERIALPLRYASFADLSAEARVVDVARLPRIRDGRFDPARRILWIEGVELATGTRAFVPFEMVHTDYTRPAPPGQGCFPCTTNGLASGNDALEATCHAICELIERDATTLWHHLPQGARDARRLDLGSVDDPACRDALDRLDAAGIETGVWETTSDVGVAVFHCVIADSGNGPGHIGIGDGCHPHRGIALLRSLTEAVQTRLTYVSGARDDLGPEEFTSEAIRKKCDYARTLLGQNGPKQRFADAPHRDARDFADDLIWLLARLRGAGCGEVVTVDLTKPEVGIPVVRTVIPGLEAPHDDADFMPGPRARAAAGEAR